MRIAVSEIEPAVAVIVTDCDDATLDVVMVNVAAVLPCGTVMLNGTCATSALVLLSATITPPNGAGPESVTVPVAEAPPFTCFDDRLRLCN